MLFVAGKNPNPNSQPDRFYAVAVGKRPGIYTEWMEAQAAYTGVKAPKYKKFESREAAEEWMATFAHATQQYSTTLKDEEDAEDEDEDDDEISYPPSKKIKQEAPLNLSSGQNQGLEAVYTDGSTLSNGQDGAVAGVGVYFGDNDPRYVRLLLHDLPQSSI